MGFSSTFWWLQNFQVCWFSVSWLCESCWSSIMLTGLSGIVLQYLYNFLWSSYSLTAMGPVSWSLTHSSFCQATISATYLREMHSALLRCLFSLVPMTLYEARKAMFQVKKSSVTFWLWSGTPCTNRVCMADKDSLTAEWIIAPRTL